MRLSPPHSHSIILSDGNALIFRCNFFLRTRKNRLPDPSEICALDFKAEFRQFGICSVSATIGINWSILFVVGRDSVVGSAVKKTVSPHDPPLEAADPTYHSGLASAPCSDNWTPNQR